MLLTMLIFAFPTATQVLIALGSHLMVTPRIVSIIKNALTFLTSARVAFLAETIVMQWVIIKTLNNISFHSYWSMMFIVHVHRLHVQIRLH